MAHDFGSLGSPVSFAVNPTVKGKYSLYSLFSTAQHSEHLELHPSSADSVAMDPRSLRFLCPSLTLLLVAVLFFFPVDHKRLIDPWRDSRHPPSVVQESSLHKSAPTNYPTKITTTASKHPQSPSPGKSSKRKPLKIAIIESMGWHDEVYAALVHAFGSQINVHLSLFFENPRWGMPDLLKTFQLTTSLPEYVYHKIDALDVAEPDIIVSTTCEYDIKNLNKRLDVLFARKKTYLSCTAHYANEWDHRHEWLEPSLTKWMEAGLMTILTLSPHVQKGFHEPSWGLSGWDSLIQNSRVTHIGQESKEPIADSKNIQWPPIELFVPVFPVSDTKKEHAESEKGQKTKKEEVAFAIQGGVNAARNYTRIISYLDDLVHSNSTSHVQNNVSLHIIGSGSEESKPTVPDSISDHIFFDQGLDYIDYYAYLSRKSALIPAFGEEEFLTVKSSSSVPASLIAGVPLVATRDILRSYSYLTAEDVYLQEDHETELDVIERIVKGSSEERRRKLKSAGARRDRLIENNVRTVEGWVEEAKGKIDR